MANDETIKSTGIYRTVTRKPKVATTDEEILALIKAFHAHRVSLLPRNLARVMALARWSVKHAGGQCVRRNESAWKWKFIPPSQWPAKPHNAEEIFEDAKRLNESLNCLRLAMQKVDIGTAVQEALMVGMLFEKLRIRQFEWGVLMHGKIKRGARNSHEPDRRRDARIKAAMDRKLSRNRNLSVSAAAVKVASEYPVPISAKTVTRIYNKLS